MPVLCAGEAGNIWSFNYFLYNRKQKRVLYFSCRGVSKTAGTDWRESSCCKNTLSAAVHVRAAKRLECAMAFSLT